MDADSVPAEGAVPEPHGGMSGRRKLLMLCLMALGVVYGDIGTSPLYAVNESMHHVAPTLEHIYGIISLVFWSLMLVVSFKYAMNILRADNHNEGGILALVALLRNGGNGTSQKLTALVVVGVFGACLLFGDGIITPAISVLSAVEGVEVATPALSSWVVPITCIILVALFAPQRFGTAKVGGVFAPVMLTWFFSIAVAGLLAIVKNPEILRAIDPRYGLRLMYEEGVMGTLMILGSVVLTVTGCEALYADMGHFGRRAIRSSWFFFVKPALLLNYFGQGAWLLAHRTELMAGWQRHVADPHTEYTVSAFYGLVQGTPWMIPMVVLATMATVVASQALISGAFSLTQQAQNLGFWPRMHITHTSGETEGQIYVGKINTFLAVACIALVLAFRKSGNLAAAYGIAVTGTMAVTSLLYYKVAVTKFGWNRLLTGALVTVFVLVDLSFLFANALKFLAGGWVPMVVACAFFSVMMTWFVGRRRMVEKIRVADVEAGVSSFETLVASLGPSHRTMRTPGCMVYMVSSETTAAHLMGHAMKIFGVIPETVIFFTVKQVSRPEVPLSEAILECGDKGNGCWRVIAACGFNEEPNVSNLLVHAAQAHGLPMPLDEVDGETVVGLRVHYMLGQEQLEGGGVLGGFFALLSASMAEPATRYFRLPANRVATLGVQVNL